MGYLKLIYLLIVILIFFLVVAGGLLYFSLVLKKPLPSPYQKTQPTTAPSPDVLLRKQFCIQVITPAKNPLTGECRNFPTPCDVPQDWETIAECT